MPKQQNSPSEYPTIIRMMTRTTVMYQGGHQYTTQNGHLFPFPLVDTGYLPPYSGEISSTKQYTLLPQSKPFMPTRVNSALESIQLGTDLIHQLISPTKDNQLQIAGTKKEELIGDDLELQHFEDLVQESSSLGKRSSLVTSGLFRSSTPFSTIRSEGSTTQDEVNGEMEIKQPQDLEALLQDGLHHSIYQDLDRLPLAICDHTQTSCELKEEGHMPNSVHSVPDTCQPDSRISPVVVIDHPEKLQKFKPWGIIVEPKLQNLLDSNPDDDVVLAVLQDTHPYTTPIITTPCLVDPSPRDLAALGSLMPPLQPTTCHTMRSLVRSVPRLGGGGKARDWADIYGDG